MIPVVALNDWRSRFWKPGVNCTVNQHLAIPATIIWKRLLAL